MEMLMKALWPVKMLRAIAEVPVRAGVWFVRQRFVMGIASLIWLLWRSGFRPNRLSYPCQQTAAAHVAVLFGGSAFLGLFTHKRWLPLLRRKVIVAGLIIGISGIIAAKGYQIIADGLSTRESCLIPQSHLADLPNYPEAALSVSPMYPSGDEAVVAIRRNTSVTYGTTSPFDKASNPAYQLVWDAICELKLGPADNPLRDFVAPGCTVTIKPNLESGDCTQAAAVRPVIDMCLAAGAAVINVGDGSACGYTQANLDSMGYTSMISTLRSRGNTQVHAVLFGPAASWSWINLGAASAYSGSSYTSSDLITSTLGSPITTYFNTPDSHAVNPNGQIINWNAVTDYLLGADVVINMPKLKVHDALVGTFGIKNWVGAGLHSTYNPNPSCDSNFARVAHWHADAGTFEYGLGNDIMWRELANIHRATIYWKNGQLQSTPQRKYLIITDGITAVNNRQHMGSGGTAVQMGTVLASTNVIASDAVTQRLMRWDFRLNPMSNNAPSVPSHPWGTNDPARIRIVGDLIGPAFGTWFVSDNFSGFPEFTAMKIDDLAPPPLSSVTATLTGSRLDFTVQSDSDAAAAFLYFGADLAANTKVARMAKNGSTFSVRMLASSMAYKVVVQDRFFNCQASSEAQVVFTANHDVNRDGRINILDLIIVRNNLNKDPMSDDSAAIADVNADGRVNILDLIAVRNRLNTL